MKLRTLLISFIFFGSCVAYPQGEIDSLLQLIRSTQDTTLKVNVINDLSFILRTSNPDTCLVLSKESERLAKLIDYEVGVANAKMQRGIAHTALGNYYLALQFFLEAKSTYEDKSLTGSMASCLNNIARVYNFIEDYDKALKYHKESVILFSEIKDSREGNILNNIGYILKLQGKYEESLEYLNRSVDLANSLNISENLTYPTYNIGSVYMHTNQFDSANKYLNKSLELSAKVRNKYLLSLAHSDIGQMHLKRNQLTKAEASLLKAFEIANESGHRQEQKEAAKHLSTIYEEKEEPGAALYYHKLYKAIDDSLFNRDLAKRMAFQEAEYNFNRERIADELESSRAKIEQEKTLSEAIWVRNSLIAGLCAMALIFFLLYMNFSRNRMANLALKKLNIKIEKQTQELLEANKEISVMNNNLESTVNKRTEQLKVRNEQLKEYLSTNSHIVRAPLSRILGLVDLYDPNDSKHLDFIIESLNTSALELDQALREINKKLSEEKF